MSDIDYKFRPAKCKDMSVVEYFTLMVKRKKFTKENNDNEEDSDEEENDEDKNKVNSKEYLGGRVVGERGGGGEGGDHANIHLIVVVLC